MVIYRSRKEKGSRYFYFDFFIPFEIVFLDEGDFFGLNYFLKNKKIDCTYV